MAVTKSILEEVELRNGSLMFYVQISAGNQVSLSFDGAEGNHSFWLSRDEAMKIAEAITKAVGESHE